MKKHENAKNTTELRNEYKEYTLGLAIFDHLPVLLFLMSGLVMYSMYSSPILLAGVLACFAGGACKATWKLIVVRQHRDLAILTRVFHILMPAGFVLMLLSVLAGGKAAFAGLWRSITMMPAALLFALGFALMCLMGYLGSHMDSSARSNWIEEIVNTMAQLAVLIGVIMVYFGTYYHADATALKALEGTDNVRVTEITQELSVANANATYPSTEKGWLFDGPGTDAVLIFYPGAKVEAAAYAPLMAAIAEGGVDCYLCKMPLNFALLGKETAEKIRANYKATASIADAQNENEAAAETQGENESYTEAQTDIEAAADMQEGSETYSDAQTDNETYSDAQIDANAYKKWYIGGHSLGGAVAAMAANDAEEAGDGEDTGANDTGNTNEASDAGDASGANEANDADVAETWDGLILLAAYPTDELTTPVLSIYGSEDSVLNRDKYGKSATDGLWPADFTEKIIEGGNHAQFGDYGAQKGDGIALIDASEQQRETADAVIIWIRKK